MQSGSKLLAFLAALALAFPAGAVEYALHRTTKELHASADELSHPVGSWIWDPDLAAVGGCCTWPTRYWTIAGDVVTLMSQGERDAVDAALLEAARDAAVAGAIDEQEEILRAFAQVLRDEINIIRSQVAHPVSSITRSGTTGTVTTFVAHGLTTGDTVTVLGAANSVAYNKVATVTVTGASTYTYTVTGSPATPATGSLYYFQGSPVGATAPRTLSQLRAAIRSKLGS